MQRKDREGKTSVFMKRDETYLKFKDMVKARGLNINKVFELFIEKVVKGEIKLHELVKD